MKRLAAALTVVAATGALPAWGGSPGRLPDDASVHLTIVEQAFGVTPGGSWTATLSLSGDVAALLAAVPSTTSTTSAGTSTPATTTATTTATTAPAGSTTASATPTTATTPTTTSIVEGDPPTAVVEVVAHQRIETAEALGDARDGRLGDELDRVGLPATDLTRTTGGATIELDVPTATEAGDDRLTLRRPGLYPVAIALIVDGDVVAERVTFIERLALGQDRDPALGIALVATLDDLGPTPTEAGERLAERQLDDLVTLGDATDAPLTVAMPPSVAQLVDGDEQRTVAGALATADLLALPALAIDPSSAVAIDRVDAFSGEVRRGEDILTTTFPDVPVQRGAWLVDGALSTAGAATLRDPLGYRLLLFDDATYRSLDGNIADFTDSSLAFEVDLGNGNSLPAMLASPLGALIDGDVDGDRTPAEEAVDIVANLVVVRRQLGPELRRNVVLVPPGGGVPDAATSVALARYVAEVPAVEMTSLTRLAAGTDTMQLQEGPVTVSLPARAGVDLSGRAERIDITRVAVEAFGSMLADSDERAAWSAELDAMWSTTLDDEAVDAQINEINAELEAVRTSVEAPEPFTFTLTGRSSPLRLNLRNNADEPRVVRIRAASSKLRFPDGDQVVTLSPGVNEITLAVEARANGTSSISIELLTPVFEQPIAEPTFLTARVNALTGLGQVITGGAVVVLVTWWFSHLRRRRRARAEPSPIAVSGDGPIVSPDAAEAAVPVPDDASTSHPDDS